MVASCFQLARRAFEQVLLTFVAQYQMPVIVNQDSPDSIVLTASSRLVRRARPDKGGRHKDIIGSSTLPVTGRLLLPSGVYGHPFFEVPNFTVPLQ